MTVSTIRKLTEDDFHERLADKLEASRFPLRGQWELTCRCNLKCVMCYTDPFNTPERIREELRYDEIIRILAELRDAGCLELCFTGGEPFARPDFLDVYADAKTKGFLVTIFTNGTLITRRIAEYLKASPPKMIEISFHGYTAKSFDCITQLPGSFEHCRRGIRLLLERSLPLTLKSLGMTVNRDEVLKIKAWADSLGKVQYKFAAGMRPRLDGSEDPYDLELSEEETAAIEQADDQMYRERQRQLEAEQNQPRRCYGGNTTFHIDAYGQLQLCSNNRRESYDLRCGSFREGFYDFLPRFPCPNRPGGLVLTELEPRGGAGRADP